MDGMDAMDGTGEERPDCVRFVHRVHAVHELGSYRDHDCLLPGSRGTKSTMVS